MLGKLMKYEFKATRRVFLPLFGLILVFAAISRFFFSYNLDRQQNSSTSAAAVTSIISTLIYAILIAVAFLMTLVVMIQRFQHNLLNDEGYLSFTLPVKVHSHISCKMIVSLVWIVLSVVVTILSIMIFASDERLISNFWEGIREMWQAISAYGAQCWALLAEYFLLALISALHEILKIYTCITLGNFSSKHKLLAGFGVYLGFNIVEQVISTMTFGNLNIFDILGLALFGSSYIRTAESAISYQLVHLWIPILFAAVLGTAYYFFTNWLLSKKLNLE